MASTAPEGKRGAPVAVVAGGAGFLGSHLSEALLAQGFQVIVLDNYTTGKEANLRGIFSHPNFSFKVGDINQGLPDLPRVDQIFHLAGVEEYINGTDISVETLLVNSIGTRNLLELAKAHRAKITLVSSVDLYSGILSSFSLKNYFGVSKRDEERFSHHEAKRYAEALTTEYFKKFGVNARIVRLADVYGPRMDLRAGTEVAELLAEALQPEVKTLTVRGDGLKVLHPTYVADVIYGLIKAATGEGTNGRIFNLVNHEAQTVLGFASSLRKVAPTHPELTFTDDYAETRLPDHSVDFEQTMRDLGWRAVVGIEEGLKRTLAHFQGSHVTPDLPHPELGVAAVVPVSLPREYRPELQHFSFGPRLKEAVLFFARRPGSSKVSSKKFGLKAAIAVFLVFIMISVLVPVGGALVYSGYGAWRLKGSEGSLLAGQADPAFAAAASAEGAFSTGSAHLSDLTFLFQLFNWSGSDSYQHLLTSAKELSTSLKEISLAMKPVLSLGQTLVATDVTVPVVTTSVDKDLASASNDLQLADDHLSTAEKELTLVSTASLPGLVQGQLEEVRAKVSQARSALSRAEVGLKVLPEVVGLNGPRNYLLLFTNNNELRPIGGFIGSYGVARFEQGRLRDLYVDDSYNLDGQVVSKVPAPQPFRDYLGVATLGLRDSNWSPDFPSSALAARSLFFQATHKQVDGVISLDIRTIENLLRVVGPINLADYNEEITADNFYDRAQVHADVDFFPGSTGKKDFIGAVARIVLDKLLHSGPTTWPALAQALQKSFVEKHLLIYSTNTEVEDLLAESGWDGAVDQASSGGDVHRTSIEDYLYVVDANLGANKANYFVKNQANYQVEVDKTGGAAAKLTLLYNHTATTETWPSGRYRDYLRVYAPLGSKLTKVEVSDTRDVPAVTTTTDLGKTVFSLLFELPSQTQKTIILSYSLPWKMPSIAKPATYHLLVQKQPGQAEPPFSVNFDVPTFLKASPSQGTSLTPYSARLTTTLAQDLDLTIGVAP